ncbi:cytochrome P450 [Stachybotrys elegans]|uniref:Cytochrome P450 n=1 Tax=Stachybotrys elegans TaxID=80388 RepID=A0A8K0SGW7_9HYPO|nr:cytochrome P450 [Stachybotrys elegans]
MIPLASFTSMSQFAVICTTTAALWLGWRLWSFTLRPMLHPELPKRYPYLIPVAGHIRGMVRHTSNVFTQGKKYFGKTREIFSLVVMGEELYIVTNPSDIQEVFKHATSLDHDAMAADILIDMGVTKSTVVRIFEPIYRSKNYIQATHDDFRAQLHPGPRLDKLQADFLAHIDKSLRYDAVKGPMVKSSPTGSKIISLWEWCGQVLVDSAIEAFFSGSLYEANPDMLQDFFTFDEESWKLPYRLPRFAAKKMYSSMDKCIDAVSKWLEFPKEKRQASWIVDQMVEGLKEVEVTDARQRGAMVFVLFRVVNSNAYRLCFWCLVYLLFDPELLKGIKEEMQPAWSSEGVGSLDMSYLLDKCPLLSSFYEEVLRFTVDTVGARVVMKETTVGGKKLSPGKKLLMPFRQGHFDTDFFGPDATSFNPRRFYDNKSLSRSPSWKPFGGGLAWCPGRFMARREVYMFLGIVLFRFDTNLYAPDHRTPVFPVLDDSIPWGGVLTPKPGHDVLVEIRARN